MNNFEKVLARQEVLNKKLATLFKERGITNFRLTSLGNSIASGYSMTRTIKPLLLRNETIKRIMEHANIKLDRYHFARAQNNGDEHMYEWLDTNIKQSRVHEMNRMDYDATSHIKMPSVGISQKELNEFYPKNVKHDIGLKDAVSENGANLANVIVYNGATGSFLDNLTRGGRLRHQLVYGVKRDVVAIEATLKKIQTNNRINGSNTQVYLCGAPNFLGLRITEIINIRLKKIAKNYANVVYVEPVVSKFLYKKLGSGHKMAFDLHHDEIEYLKLNNNVIDSIVNNYRVREALINVDRHLYGLSTYIELEANPFVIGNDYINKMVSSIISSEYAKLEDNKDKKMFLKLAKRYVIDRMPYDFYYVGKDNVKTVLDEVNPKVRTKIPNGALHICK